VHPQDAVAVFLGQVGDVGAGGFEDAQAGQTQHRDQREVVAVGRPAGGGQDCFELLVPEPEGRGLGGDARPTDMLGPAAGVCSLAMTQCPPDPTVSEVEGDRFRRQSYSAA
jgi:hypothetical protein